MIRRLAVLASLALAAPATAQLVPVPERDNMRLQHVAWQADQAVLLTVLPNASLTVMLPADERIERVTLGEAAPLEVRVTGDGNSFIAIPQGDISRTTLEVDTAQRRYAFILRTLDSPLAALMVRFDGVRDDAATTAIWQPEGGPLWSYRFRGDDAVRPQSIRDDAHRTFIEYAPDQALPAVFAVGPTGEEEVVNGYMRNGVFVIDRVYSELVFRMNEARARAMRNAQPDNAG